MVYANAKSTLYILKILRYLKAIFFIKQLKLLSSQSSELYETTVEKRIHFGSLVEEKKVLHFTSARIDAQSSVTESLTQPSSMVNIIYSFAQSEGSTIDLDPTHPPTARPVPDWQSAGTSVLYTCCRLIPVFSYTQRLYMLHPPGPTWRFLTPTDYS